MNDREIFDHIAKHFSTLNLGVNNNYALLNFEDHIHSVKLLGVSLEDATIRSVASVSISNDNVSFDFHDSLHTFNISDPDFFDNISVMLKKKLK